MAVECRLPTVVDKLLDAGAQPNARTAEGVTALQLAIEHCWPELVEILLGKGAGVRIPTSTGGSFLDLARQKGNPKIIGLLEARLARYARRRPAGGTLNSLIDAPMLSKRNTIDCAIIPFMDFAHPLPCMITSSTSPTSSPLGSVEGS